MDTAALKGEGGVEKAVGRGGHCSCLWWTCDIVLLCSLSGVGAGVKV